MHIPICHVAIVVLLGDVLGLGPGPGLSTGERRGLDVGLGLVLVQAGGRGGCGGRGQARVRGRASHLRWSLQVRFNSNFTFPLLLNVHWEAKQKFLSL